jgi:hypothetical protein
MRHCRPLTRLAPALALLALAAVPSVATAAPDVRVVADGLDSPRHLAFGGDGDLFVAEAGRGGDQACFSGPEGGQACIGATGAVTRIDRHGNAKRIVTGLPSQGNTSGPVNAVGPHGIAVRGDDDVYITSGGPQHPTRNGVFVPRDQLAQEFPPADLLGRVLRVRHHGVEKLVDVWAFERDVNPDAAVGNPEVDSNPVDLLLHHGNFVIADAGGNAIDVADDEDSSDIRALTVFANRPTPGPGGETIPMQAVPTAVVKGPDGAYYVSQLTGFPFPVGAARIYRVDPRTGDTTIFAEGFTNIMDLAFGRHGRLYVLEIDADGLLNPSTDGALIAVDRDGTKHPVDLPAGTLTHPGGLTITRRAAYVSNNTIDAGVGQVLRIGLGG